MIQKQPGFLLKEQELSTSTPSLALKPLTWDLTFLIKWGTILGVTCCVCLMYLRSSVEQVKNALATTTTEVAKQLNEYLDIDKLITNQQTMKLKNK